MTSGSEQMGAHLSTCGWLSARTDHTPHAQTHILNAAMLGQLCCSSLTWSFSTTCSNPSKAALTGKKQLENWALRSGACSQKKQNRALCLRIKGKSSSRICREAAAQLSQLASTVLRTNRTETGFAAGQNWDGAKRASVCFSQVAFLVSPGRSF